MKFRLLGRERAIAQPRMLQIFTVWQFSEEKHLKNRTASLEIYERAGIRLWDAQSMDSFRHGWFSATRGRTLQLVFEKSGVRTAQVALFQILGGCTAQCSGSHVRKYL